MSKKTPLQKIIAYLDNEDFRDNYKKKELIKFLSEIFIVKLKKQADLSNIEHPDRKLANRIIEYVIEPFMFLMANNIRNHPTKTPKDIVKELDKGLEGKPYYEMEDGLTKIINDK